MSLVHSKPPSVVTERNETPPESGVNASIKQYMPGTFCTTRFISTPFIARLTAKCVNSSGCVMYVLWRISCSCLACSHNAPSVWWYSAGTQKYSFLRTDSKEERDRKRQWVWSWHVETRGSNPFQCVPFLPQQSAHRSPHICQRGLRFQVFFHP